MSISFRMLMITALVPMFLLLPLTIQAKDDPKQLEQAKACTKECGSKHGTGMDKQKYDRGAYESCMSKCTSEPSQSFSSPKK